MTSAALTPPVVDAMELWEVAVVLGKARPDSHSAAPRRRSVRSMAADRLRAWREGKPQPRFEDRPQPLPAAVGTLIPTNLPSEGTG